MVKGHGWRPLLTAVAAAALAAGTIQASLAQRISDLPPPRIPSYAELPPELLRSTPVLTVPASGLPTDGPTFRAPPESPPPPPPPPKAQPLPQLPPDVLYGPTTPKLRIPRPGEPIDGPTIGPALTNIPPPEIGTGLLKDYKIGKDTFSAGLKFMEYIKGSKDGGGVLEVFGPLKKYFANTLDAVELISAADQGWDAFTAKLREKMLSKGIDWAISKGGCVALTALAAPEACPLWDGSVSLVKALAATSMGEAAKERMASLFKSDPAPASGASGYDADRADMKNKGAQQYQATAGALQAKQQAYDEEQAERARQEAQARADAAARQQQANSGFSFLDFLGQVGGVALQVAGNGGYYGGGGASPLAGSGSGDWDSESGNVEGGICHTYHNGVTSGQGTIIGGKCSNVVSSAPVQSTPIQPQKSGCGLTAADRAAGKVCVAN